MPTYGLVTDPNVIGQLNAASAQEYGGASTGQQAGIGSLPGVDENLRGDAYLRQFPPEIQAAAKNYISGDTKPTGNPRRIDIVKMVAGKYASDLGMNIDDTIFNGRNETRKELASAKPNTMGGQLNAGTTALDHLAKIARLTSQLHGFDTPIAPLNWGLNALTQYGTEKQSLMGAIDTAALHYGQEVAKFYGGASSGEHERERFMSLLSAVKSPRELAAVIEAEMSLIPGKMDSIRSSVQELGPFIPRKQQEMFDRQDKAASVIGDYVHSMRSGKPVADATRSWQHPEDMPAGQRPGAGVPSGTAPAPGPGGTIPAPAGVPGAAAPLPSSGVLPVPGPGPAGPPPGPAGATFGPTPGPGGPAPGVPPPLVPLQPVPAPGQMRAPAPAAAPGPMGAAPAAIPEGAVAVNRQTGQRIIRRGGVWVPVP